MAERKRIGLVYIYNKDWIAGAYYVLNILKSLKRLSDDRQPVIVLFYNTPDGLELVREVGYKHIKYVKFKSIPNVIKRIVNKALRVILKRNVFVANNFKSLVNNVYPANWMDSNIEHKYFWIPDFQEDYYPVFFTEQEVKSRKTNQKRFSLEKNGFVVLSSEDSANDFKRLYPNHVCGIKTLHFATVLESNYQQLNINDLRSKFQIEGEYYFSPNQFWQHKNHKVILQAISELKKDSVNILVAFSGKENDYRNKNYFTELKIFIKENGIDDNVKFLGFIDRDEQLQLINHAKAVIQPSLFEGWSTVVEDAKALNKFVILSDLPVHKEQLKDNVYFFNRFDATDLKNTIIKFEQNSPVVKQMDYENNIRQFAEDLMQILN